MAKGRKTGGRQKGSLNKATLDKENAREVARRMITAELAPMIAAQIEHAKGIKYLVVRAKQGGKFLRVTESMAKARQELQKDEEIIEVWEKDPSVQAFTDLLNRALDKPKEQEQDLNIKGSIDIVAVLRKRFDRHQSKPE